MGRDDTEKISPLQLIFFLHFFTGLPRDVTQAEKLISFPIALQNCKNPSPAAQLSSPPQTYFHRVRTWSGASARSGASVPT